jgi:hypothetical protein
MRLFTAIHGLKNISVRSAVSCSMTLVPAPPRLGHSWALFVPLAVQTQLSFLWIPASARTSSVREKRKMSELAQLVPDYLPIPSGSR